MSTIDYKNLFLSNDQFLTDNTTNFLTKINDIVSIINNHSKIENNWIDKNHLNSLSESDLLLIQNSVANGAQNELVNIVKPYIEPQIIKLFGDNQDINIRVSAQIKNRWSDDILRENRKVRFDNNGWYEDSVKPNMSFPTRVHQDLDNNGNRSSHVIIFYFQITENYKNCSMLQVGSFQNKLCILENNDRNGYPNEITSDGMNQVNWEDPIIKPGDIALMSPLTIHRSTHKAEIPRIALNVKFQPQNLDYMKNIYGQNLCKLADYHNLKEKLVYLKEVIESSIAFNRALLFEKATISLLQEDIQGFYLDIKELFNYDISHKDLNKLAAACILRKSTHFISEDDLSCLKDPINNIVEGSCASSILKTINRF